MNYDKSNQGCNVYNQYLQTNLELLIQGKCDIYNQNLVPYKKSFQEFSNLNLATGTALDHKGKLLNMSRYITFNDRLNVVLPDTPGISEYKYLQGDTKQCRLNDDSYRIVLKLLSQSKNTAASVQTLSKIISDIVNAEVFVGDNMDMRYITYYFLDRIPGWLEVTMHNYDILPRPAGMETKYISAISRLFGFLITTPELDKETTAKLYSSFWKTRFPKTPQTFKPHINSFKDFIFSGAYNFVNISPEVFERLKLQIRTIISAASEAMQEELEATKEILHRAERVDKVKSMNYNLYNDDDPPAPKPSLSSEISEALTTPQDNLASWKNGLWYVRAKTLDSLWKQEDLVSKLPPYELYNRKLDIRKGYYYDRYTGWYFWVPPDNSGKFDPSYIAPLYQDSCGIWRAEDPLIVQLSKRQTLVYSDNPGYKRVTKTVRSPFLDYYIGKISIIPLWNLMNPDPSDWAAVDRMRRWRKLFENFNRAMELFHQAKNYHKYSFRRILDLEYKALGWYKHKRYLSRYKDDVANININPEVYYYSRLWKRLDRFLGEHARDGSDGRGGLWNSSNTDAPIYKYRDFLIWLRWKLNRIQSEMYSLSQANENIYQDLLRDGYTVPNDFYYKIRWLSNQLTRVEYWNKYEISDGLGVNTRGWSATVKTNRQCRDRKVELIREAEWWESQAGRLDIAAGACHELRELAHSGLNNTVGKFSKCRLCWLAKDNAGMPNWGDGNDGSNTEITHSNVWNYYKKEWTFYAEHENRQKQRAADKRKQAANNRSWAARLDKELAMRTVLTENRTLDALMQEYNSTTPSNRSFPDLEPKDPLNTYFII